MDKKNTTFASYWSLNTIMLWLFCMTLLLLILPFDMVSADLAASIKANNKFLYLALIVEVSNFIALSLISMYKKITFKKQEKVIEDKIVNSVDSLDFAERALLREFVLQRKSVLNLPVYEPTVSFLLDSNILTLTSSIDAFNRADITISKKARPYITYKAIGLTRGQMSEQMLSQIMSARPSFAREEKPMPKAYRGVRAA